ncbi:MAG: hypothetical protein AAGE94_21570 [Acidobacteriota bacterium]
MPIPFEPSSDSVPPSELSDPAMANAVDRLCAELDLDPAARGALLAAYLPLCRAIDHRRRQHGTTSVVGVHGAQGSGKTTFCRFATLLLERLHGWRVCGFSIDDLYLTRAERRDLAERVHPLLATRGVPGTHDIDLGRDLIRRLRQADDTREIAVPAFDKAIDDRLPIEAWPRHRGTVDIVLFEGWCVGCRPQGDALLVEPINALETTEDPDGTWRRYVDRRLRTDYAELFAEIDQFVMLQVPSFDHVRRWRRLQEEKLARRRPGAEGLMDADTLDRFLMTYERTTRHALDTLPAVADVVCRIDDAHRIVAIDAKEPSS